MHLLFKDVLDFPDYYGCNWDALWDCLSEMYGEPIHVEIIGLDEFEGRCPETKAPLIRILKKFKHAYTDYNIPRIFGVEPRKE